MSKFFPESDAGGALQGGDAPRPAPASVEINSFQGMASNINPHILRGQYTSRQDNLMSVEAGQAQVRGGLKRIYFDGAD